MALHLVYGSSLSNKTEELYDVIIRESEAHPDRNYVIIVPEQASLMVQESIVNRHPRHGVSNIDILTFNRLAFKVFKDNDLPTLEAMDETGKILLLRYVTLLHEKELKVLRKGIRKVGMLTELKSVISELVQYNISPEELKKQAEKLGEHKALQGKIEDIALIYEAFMTQVHKQRELAEERVARLADAISNWGSIENTVFAFDDFTGFTPPQYNVLTTLIQRCPDIYVGITLGRGEEIEQHKNEDDLFYMSAHMASRLKEIAIMKGISYEETRAAETEALPEICHIEKQIYRYPQTEFSAETDRIQFVKAKNGKNEIAALLHAVLQDVKNGYRYRDIGVIMGNPEDEREEIETCFSDAGVPFFIDSQKNVSDNALCCFLRDAMKIVDTNFSFDAVFSFAKNPIVVRMVAKKRKDELPAYERICEIENIALAYGFRGAKAYSREWEIKSRSFKEYRLPVVNETKDAVIMGALRFAEEISKAASVREKINACRKLMACYDTETALSQIANGIIHDEKEKRSEAQKKLLADEYSDIFRFVNGILDQYENIFEDTEMGTDLFFEVLSTGLQNVFMKHVPPTKDRVVIGNLKRTRLGKIRKLYVLRVNEGVLPESHSGSGLLSDRDREVLKEGNVILAETAKEKAFFDRYYFYLLLTKPQDSLTLSYVTANNDGKGVLPSDLIGTLRKMFPRAAYSTAEKETLFAVNSPNGGLNLLAEKMAELKANGGAPEKNVQALYQWYDERKDWEEELFKIGEGLFYRHNNEKLTKELAKKLYSDELRGSVSLLESYAQCPYRHFLNYGLRLREKEQFKIEATDLGTLLHDSIDSFFRTTKAEGKQWFELSEQEEKQLLGDCVKQVVSDSRNGLLTDNARNSYVAKRIERLCNRTIWALKKQWKAGSFETTETEIEFGEGKEIPAIALPLSDGGKLVLQGRIDRMDLAEDEDRVYVKIIDYKSSARDLNFTKIKNGTQLQLLLYLGAASRGEEKKHAGKQVVPAGVYYYGMTDPLVKRGKNNPEDQIFNELSLHGLTNSAPEVAAKVDADFEKSKVVKGLKGKDGEVKGGIPTADFECLGQFALQKAAELGNSILDGEIAVAPILENRGTGCDFCPYQSVCGFDTRIEGYHGRQSGKVELEELVKETNASETEGENK